LELTIDLPEEQFASYCANTIAEKKQTIEQSLCDSIIYAIRESLKATEFFIDASYRYLFELYDDCLSLKEYIQKGFRIHYFEIKIECKNPVNDSILLFPSYIIPGDMGRNYPHSFEANYKLTPDKKTLLKTKTKFSFKPWVVRIPQATLEKIYVSLPDISYLLPSNFSPRGDWRQTFYNPKTGESFFCDCFRKAIKNKSRLFTVTHPHVKYALENESYLPGICHLCTKTTPPIKDGLNREYSFARTFGAYIFKTQCQSDKEISYKDAENIIRKMFGYPLIGEGWISETLLYEQIKKAFPKTEVIHHGRPPFLGRQEYDIWMPEYKIAIEYQGIQHYEVVEHWGGEEGLERRQELDKKKFEISKENGVSLIYVDEGYSIDTVIQKIEAAMKP